MSPAKCDVRFYQTHLVMAITTVKTVTKVINIVSIDTFFSATVSDDTSSSWISVFDDQAKQLLDGITADDMHKIYTSDETMYDGHFAKATFTDWIFTCKVKQEMYDDQTRVK